MVQRVNPTTKIRVVPREGELEITLNINISIDGVVNTTVEEVKQLSLAKEEDEEVLMVPTFGSSKLNFGKVVS